MKYVLILLASFVLSSCSAQEDKTGTMPDVITPDDGKAEVIDYTFEWRSNQSSAHMDITIYPADGSKPIVVNNITNHTPKFPLKPGDKFLVNIKCKKPVSNPEIYLAIYKTDDIFADEGLLYEEEIEASGIGLIATIDKNGKLK